MRTARLPATPALARADARSGPAGGLAAAAGDRIDGDGRQEHAARDHELDRRRERQEVHPVRDGADHERAEQRRPDGTRSEERRVGKEWRSRWWRSQEKEKARR